ncbi:DUF4280 domain-containing protein [Brevibacillus sp. HB1.3]|uniref:DUF4280 domain-containing protein n=1 Tax=Brevibacillus sp. HB1.3 TaxID=2738842 RepID=UPI001553A379|nr:DUF4280 domain-containing protein [Brevibacillus sp. HB1.3]
MPNIEDITVQKSNAERKSYVVVGAILSCSNGSKVSRLKMLFSHGVFVKGKPQMNIMDFIPNKNIMPFGNCSSLKNPAVASATAANNGVLTPMPCTPLTTMPWIDGKADKVVGGHPALLNKSTNMCFHCGLIKIEDDGQDLGGVTLGVQSLAQSGPTESGFGQGLACEKPQEKPTMWDNFVKGISKLGDVPAAMQKATSELQSALEKAAEDLPKGVGVFVREGYIEPIQEDIDTLRDDTINIADGIAIGGLALQALTLGRSKNIKDLIDAAKKGKKVQPNIQQNLYRRTSNTGEFKDLSEPMQLRHVEKVAEDAGIGLKGIKIEINRDAELVGKDLYGWADPKGNRIILYPDAFSNKENLVKTLGHERIHIYQTKTFGKPEDHEMLLEFEKGAYGSEDSWWEYYKRKRR